MATRSARSLWKGSLQEGTGDVKLTSSDAGEFAVTFPKRISDAADGTTPEELIAAAHAACFSMALSGDLAKAGATPSWVDVRSEVTIEPDPAGGLRITKSALTVLGEVDGIDEAGFQKVAEGTKTGCPVSKALLGNVEITLNASFA